MAFASTITRRNVVGNVIRVTGQGVNTDGSTGGEVPTGLRRVESFVMSKNGAAVDANQYAANETFPTDTGDITVVTTADVTFTWVAEGTE